MFQMSFLIFTVMKRGRDIGENVSDFEKRKKAKDSGKSKGKKPTLTQQIQRVLTKTLESKYWATNQAPTNVDYSGTVTSLTDVVTGTTDQSRIGDKIKPKYMYFNFQAVAADTTNMVKVVIFRWAPPSSTGPPVVPGIQDVLDGVVINSDNACLGNYVWDNRANFTVLKAETFALANHSAGPLLAERQWYIDLKSAPMIQYTASSIHGKYKIFVLVISDSGAIPYPTIQWYSRFVYYDA